MVKVSHEFKCAYCGHKSRRSMMYSCSKCDTEFCELCSESKNLYTVKVVSRSVMETTYVCDNRRKNGTCYDFNQGSHDDY